MLSKPRVPPGEHRAVEEARRWRTRLSGTAAALLVIGVLALPFLLGGAPGGAQRPSLPPPTPPLTAALPPATGPAPGAATGSAPGPAPDTADGTVDAAAAAAHQAVPTTARAATTPPSATRTAATPTAPATPRPPATPAPTPSGSPAPASAAPVAPSVTYTSWSSGLCLGVASAIPAAGSTLRVATCGSPTARAFRTPAVGAGLALVDPVTGLCVEVAGASSADGAQVVLATCANRTYQQFRTSATAYSDGMVRLVAVHSGKCLDIADQAYARPGSVVHQWTCHTAWEERGLRNQSWRQS